jgi:hypothetical protein
MNLVDFLMVVLGGLTSVLFSYLPGLSEWFDTLGVKQKRLVMAGVLLVISVASVALACAGYAADLGIPVVCSQSGVIEVLKAFVMAVIGNQSAYTLTRKD